MHSNMKAGFGADNTPSSSAVKLGGHQESSQSPIAVEKHVANLDKASSLLDEV